MALLHTEHMAVGYDRTILIDDIELSVRAGEVLTLIGPNGAGKSTILKSITRSLALIGGAVYLDGQSLHHMTERQAARRMSVLLTGRLEPELMTCREVVETGRHPYTGRFGILSAHDKEVVERTMRTVHVEELAERNFLHISDGQRQRVLLARAICQEPEVLILDEPTSYLDIRHKLELLQLLKQLVREQHLAVIVSLHELDLAQRISDTVVCVGGNKIDRIGTPEEIFAGDYIRRLYGVQTGSFDGTYGSVELERPHGAPQVFVICGGGTGIPLFRQLQRMDVPFAVGVLHENDLDLPAARQLAQTVITETAFEPVSEEKLREALAVMAQTQTVLCTLTHFGTMNRNNAQLVQKARENGTLTDLAQFKQKWKDRNSL